MQSRLIFIALVALLAQGCSGTATPADTAAADEVAARATPEPFETRRDYHSFANPDEARVEHVDLDLAVDFKRHTLAGTAMLKVALTDGARELVLDTRDLTIVVHNWQAGVDSLEFAGMPVDVRRRTPKRAGTAHYDASKRRLTVRVAWDHSDATLKVN